MMKWLIKCINFVKKHKGKIAIGLIIIILILGVIGNFIASSQNHISPDHISQVKTNFWKVFFESITILGLNVPEKVNIYNGIAYFLAVVLVYAGFFLLAFNNLLNKRLFKLFLRDKNVVLFGFGEINKNFLENFKKEKKNVNVIVVDKENKDFDNFWEEGYVFLKKEIDEEFIDKFKIKIKNKWLKKFFSFIEVDLFEKTTNIIVALGNDRVNIDIALKIIDKLKDVKTEIVLKYDETEKRIKEVKTETKLIVHISDKDIGNLFFEKLEKIKLNEKLRQIEKLKLKFSKEKKSLLITKNLNNIINIKFLVDLKIFSFNTEVIDDLFDKYSIKFVPYEYAKINSEKKELKVAIIGKSDISIELIKRIFVNFVFPNEVKTIIYLIDGNEKEFYEKVKFETNYTFSKFPHISLKPIKLTYDLLKNKDFWCHNDLKDIFIVFENENMNLEIALDLYEKIFVHKDKESYPNIFFGMYEGLAFSEYIDKNKENFKNFYTFGNMKNVFSVANLFDEERFEIAKQIHYDYGTEFNEDKIIVDKEKMKNKWFDSAKYSDKLSNISQYEHIPYKLLSLGFYRKKSDKDIKELLKYNRDIFCKKLKNIDGFIDKTLIEKFSIEVEKSYKGSFNKQIVDEFWEKFLNSGDFIKLIEVEHKRWMAYHFLNGWDYNNKKDKVKKLHNCLVYFNKFDNYGRKLTVIYDIYSYLYLPNYLAAGKYKIVKIEDEK